MECDIYTRPFNSMLIIQFHKILRRKPLVHWIAHLDTQECHHTPHGCSELVDCTVHRPRLVSNSGPFILQRPLKTFWSPKSLVKRWLGKGQIKTEVSQDSQTILG